MYARVNTIFGDRARVETGVAQLEDSDRRGVEGMDGNRGLTTMTDRDGGVIVAVSYWDEPTHASEATLTRAREAAAAAAGGDLVVETYEVVLRRLLTEPPPDAVVRMVRMRIPSDRDGACATFVRDEVLTDPRAATGLCRAELLLDARSQSGVLLTVWASETDAAHVDTLVERLRDEAARRAGITSPRVERYVLVRSSEPASSPA